MTTFAVHPLVTGKRLVVAAAADEAYAMPLAVMLRSAAASLGGAWGLDAYVVSDGLSKAPGHGSKPRCPTRHRCTG